MKIGILPQKCPVLVNKENINSDYRTMEMKIHDERYIEQAVCYLADILYDWMLAVRKENE